MVPVSGMVENIIGCKWSLRILQLCADGQRRPSALLRASPGLSAKVLNERLRKMIRYGILQRTVCREKPPLEVDYQLTPFGRRFMGIVDEVRRLQDAVDRGGLTQGCFASRDQDDEAFKAAILSRAVHHVTRKVRACPGAGTDFAPMIEKADGGVGHSLK